MPRRLLYPEGANAAAAQALTEFVGAKPKRRAYSPNKAREEVRAMLADGNFENAKAPHLVALYEWCHEQVYGVAPAELSQGETWKHATFAASKLLKEAFAGDLAETVAFVRWTWRRERSREQQRRDGRSETIGRIGWRLQFVHRHLVTDYRIDKARST